MYGLAVVEARGLEGFIFVRHAKKYKTWELCIGMEICELYQLVYLSVTKAPARAICMADIGYMLSEKVA